MREINGDGIVLMNHSGTDYFGMYLNSGGDYNIGDYDDDWDINNFVEYEDEIILCNGIEQKPPKIIV